MKTLKTTSFACGARGRSKNVNKNVEAAGERIYIVLFHLSKLESGVKRNVFL